MIPYYLCAYPAPIHQFFIFSHFFLVGFTSIWSDYVSHSDCRRGRLIQPWKQTKSGFKGARRLTQSSRTGETVAEACAVPSFHGLLQMGISFQTVRASTGGLAAGLVQSYSTSHEGMSGHYFPSGRGPSRKKLTGPPGQSFFFFSEFNNV